MTKHTFTLWHVFFRSPEGKIVWGGATEHDPGEPQPWSPGFKHVETVKQTFTFETDDDE